MTPNEVLNWRIGRLREAVAAMREGVADLRDGITRVRADGIDPGTLWLAGQGVRRDATQERTP